jgi:hypothetical protein
MNARQAQAMVLTLRYAGLGIGVMAIDGSRSHYTGPRTRWRIFLRSEKSGKPVVPAHRCGDEGTSGRPDQNCSRRPS